MKRSQYRSCTQATVRLSHRISAVIASLRRVRGDMVREHLSTCAEAVVNGKLPAAKAKRLAEWAGALMTRLE